MNDLNVRQKVIKLVNSSDSAEAFENANSLYQEALKSQEPALRNTAIEYLLSVKANDLALRLAKSNVQAFPDSFEAWNALAVSYEKLGQKQNAISAREATIKLDPLNQEIQKILENDKQSD